MSHEGEGWDWSVLVEGSGSRNAKSIEHVQVALLMDIRSELRKLNATLGCYRLQRMADAMVDLNRRIKGRRMTVRDAAKVMASRRNKKKRAKP